MWEQRFSVKGEVVVVTGAGRGIGRVLALAFAEAGAKLVLAGRSAEELAAVQAEASELAASAIAVQFDLTSLDTVIRLVDRAVAAFGRLDVLVNNAGLWVNRLALDLTEEEWDLMLDVNLKGLFFCARETARVMMTQGGGRIINISSALATVAQPGYACYSAAKAGVQQLTRVLALEWAPHNITVNAIAPTTTVVREKAGQLQTPAALARAREKIPLGGRFGVPDDLVGAALYLASPASAFMTGQTLLIDGGFSLP
jgi:2-deoxy-D-gluconate 3-dehydrogenase